MKTSHNRKKAVYLISPVLLPDTSLKCWMYWWTMEKSAGRKKRPFEKAVNGYFFPLLLFVKKTGCQRLKEVGRSGIVEIEDKAHGAWMEQSTDGVIVKGSSQATEFLGMFYFIMSSSSPTSKEKTSDCGNATLIQWHRRRKCIYQLLDWGFKNLDEFFFCND